MRRGGLLGEEQVLEPAIEHLRAPPAGSTYTIWLRSATADAGRFSNDERSEQQVDVLLVDQPLVIGDHRVLTARVVQDGQLDGPSKQSPGFIREVSPDLVAALASHPWLQKSPVSGSEMPTLIGSPCAAPPSPVALVAPVSPSSPQAAATNSSAANAATTLHRIFASDPLLHPLLLPSRGEPNGSSTNDVRVPRKPRGACPVEHPVIARKGQAHPGSDDRAISTATT